LVFPTVAFGALLPGIVAGQFVAKVFGGFLWAVILTFIVGDFDRSDRKAI
jgi:fructose-specific phosphotransferase system IIC component